MSCCMRNKQQGAFIAEMLGTARYEVLPTPTIEEKVAALVPTDVTVTVTASPAKGIEPTLALCERLAGRGYRTVPHLAARMIAGRRHLEEICDRMRGGGLRPRV